MIKNFASLSKVCVMHLFQIPVFNAGNSKVMTEVQRKLKKKQKSINKEITVLKKELAKKQPLKSQSLYQKFHHREIYQKIDTQLEAFFHKRSYNIENFNFLINLLVEQKKFSYIEQVLKKMNMINISPDQRTYNYLIKAAAQQGNILKAQQCFQKASKLFLPNKYFYTTLIQCYTKNSNSLMADSILRQMIQKGINPDLPVYTSVINCHRIDRNLPRCWQIHRDIVKKGIELDQTYVGVMLKVYAATHDTEKCIKLYRQNIMDKKITPMIETKNSYLKALASRVQYSKDAIDMFFSMFQKGQILTQQTIRWALKACSMSANLTSAIQILKVMKLSNIQPSKPIFNSLLRVYGKVCSLPDMNQDFRQLVLMDTFKLLEQIQAKGMIDTTILNNVMNVFAVSDQSQKVDGLILPMYDKLGLEYNCYTFQILMTMYYKRRDFNTALRVWKQCKFDIEEKQKKFDQIEEGQYKKQFLIKKQQYRQTFNMLQMHLEIGIKLMDMTIVLESLKMFQKLDRLPKNQTLKFLGELKNLPEQILVMLMKFKIRFGKARLSKSNQGHVEDPQNK